MDRITLDHIIIGNDDRCYSFRENGIMPVSKNRFTTQAAELQFKPVAAEPVVSEPAAAMTASTEKKTDRIKAVTDKLEAGIAALFESEKYKAYLSTMAKFHNYSLNNTLLIAMQRPDATLVAGYQAWQRQHERHVRKGEKGIQIIAPSPYKAKEVNGMENPIVRLENITIENFKNVKYGQLSFANNRKAFRTSILGLYGQNGSGKTALIDAIELLQYALKGLPVPVRFADYIHIEANQSTLSYEFSVSTDKGCYTAFLFSHIETRGGGYCSKHGE